MVSRLHQGNQHGSLETITASEGGMLRAAAKNGVTAVFGVIPGSGSWSQQVQEVSECSINLAERHAEHLRRLTIRATPPCPGATQPGATPPSTTQRPNCTTNLSSSRCIPRKTPSGVQSTPSGATPVHVSGWSASQEGQTPGGAPTSSRATSAHISSGSDAIECTSIPFSLVQSPLSVCNSAIIRGPGGRVSTDSLGMVVSAPLRPSLAHTPGPSSQLAPPLLNATQILAPPINVAERHAEHLRRTVAGSADTHPQLANPLRNRLLVVRSNRAILLGSIVQRLESSRDAAFMDAATSLHELVLVSWPGQHGPSLQHSVSLPACAATLLREHPAANRWRCGTRLGLIFALLYALCTAACARPISLQPPRTSPWMNSFVPSV